jgi:hypothetical protein
MSELAGALNEKATNWSLELRISQQVIRFVVKLKKRKRPHQRPRSLISMQFFGVADGARTHDNRNHNPGLYQLSYSHH